jgi:hypothetical protein
MPGLCCEGFPATSVRSECARPMFRQISCNFCEVCVFPAHVSRVSCNLCEVCMFPAHVGSLIYFVLRYSFCGLTENCFLFVCSQVTSCGAEAGL